MGANRVRRALIAGGGIGGVAAGLALRRRGIEPVVFERARGVRDGGAGLHVWTNGMIGLHCLGVTDAVLATAPVQRVCEFRTWRGELLGAWPVGDLARKYGQPTVAIARSELHRVLVSALGGEHLRTGAEVVGYRQDRDGVTALFADGGQERGDVLIGADGVHSAVRRALLGDGPPRYTGYIAWRGQVPLSSVEGRFPPGTFCAMFGPGTRFTYYDVAPGLMHWMSVANGRPGGRDGPGAKAALVDRHREWAGPARAFVAATPEPDIVRHDVVDRPPTDRWGAGRVTLLGDAAHPITFNIGQGACQAVEDALVLAEHLSRGDDPVAALRAYERERRPRTASMQRMAWRIGRMGAWEHPAAIRLREAFMRAAWPRQAFRAAEKDQIAYATRWLGPHTDEEHR